MASKEEEDFLNRFKKEHQGTWLDSPKAGPFLTEFSKYSFVIEPSSINFLQYTLIGDG